MQAKTDIATASARRYLGQLCKHFGHKVPTELATDNRRGRIDFPDLGTCRLAAAEDTLYLTAEAGDGDALGRLQEVITSHLLRFAFREELQVAWSAA